MGAVTSFLGNVTLAPGTFEAELAVTTYEILGNGTCSIDYCETLGNPVVNVNVADTSASTFFPTVSGGTVSTGISFRRGDADSDGDFVGLLDGIFILNYQFTGGATPACLEAADLDGDGSIVGLLDGVFALAFQFTGGPPPPAPGVECGIVSDMLLGCEEPSCP